MTAPQPKAHDTAAGPGSSGSRPPAHRRRTGILLALAATVTVLASCSSSSHSTASAGGSNTTAAVGSSATSATTAAAGSTGSGASSGGSPATGSPIYVGTECGAQPPQDMSECTTVPTAYFDQINAQGGINGHPIKVVTCYSTTNPNNMSYCLQSLMANSKVVAIVGGAGDNGLLRFDTGSNAVAVLAPEVDVTDDLTSPYSFPVSNFSEVGGSLGALARYGLQQGYQNPVLLECEYQACTDVQDALNKIYSGTSSHLKSIVAPIAAPNYTTYLAAAQHAKGGLVMIAETAQDDASMVQTALNLDYHPVFGWTYSCYDDVAIEAVKGVDATILCPQPFKNWTDVGSQLEATMKQYGPSKWHWNYITVLSWIGAHMFVDAAKTVNGPVTRQSVVNAMNHVTNFTNEFLPGPIDFSKPGPSPLAPRIPSYQWYIYKVTNGTLQPVTPTAINVPPVS